MNILLLGVGNLLLSDEGVGVRTLEALEQRFSFPDGVVLQDGGTSGMELLEVMASRDLIVVVDAVQSDSEPGSLFILEDKDVPAYFTERLSPHQLGLADVLMALQMTDEFPRKLVLLGIEPASLAPGMVLSPVVARAMEAAITQVIRILNNHGIQVTALEDNHAG
ncbi:HyaD/HybD family hydrogenase maturation endopeptidase [Superficieibacter electus]|uniref:HyaD/HybD family hydrogenase maturation endopeptidase n=1 Tax=Superficieibacter electus TaxID=2022662 RepID=A0A2P5GND6_9ENTR|nr:HyaD/HybD family hydrogenase maturation endopeptidase [Superficieibacter electus]POP43604.1 HyaD/HybD family hydrogenase maturation endopeptidase [Superficieibacter electus]POP48072.1 HyaD/HybD family hydrogenase maturation endopeptidase [Superficieibacter electus]